RVELEQLLEEFQRVEEDADHVVERVEVVDADEARRLRLVVIEVLVPAPVVHDDEVALLPRMVDTVDLAVPAPRDDVEPCLAAVTMARLVEARRELVHHRGETGGVVADRLVDEEEAARAALRDEAAHLVETREEPCALGAGPLRREALRAPRVRVLALARGDLARTRSQVLHRRVTAVLEERDAKLPEHRLHAPRV